MENKQMNFDPMTGQPIVQNINTNNTPINNEIDNNKVASIPTGNTNESIQTTQTVLINQQQEIGNINNNSSIQQQMQSIPTVEQNKQDFISNTQADSTAKEEVKKDGPNITFIVIMFLIIFAAIFFLFPYLLKILG